MVASVGPQRERDSLPCRSIILTGFLGRDRQDVMSAIAVIPNLPAIVLAAPLLSIALELSPWLGVPIAIVTLWLAWNVLLVFLEWRAFVNEWIFLRLH